MSAGDPEEDYPKVKSANVGIVGVTDDKIDGHDLVKTFLVGNA